MRARPDPDLGLNSVLCLAQLQPAPVPAPAPAPARLEWRVPRCRCQQPPGRAFLPTCMGGWASARAFPLVPVSSLVTALLVCCCPGARPQALSSHLTSPHLTFTLTCAPSPRPSAIPFLHCTLSPTPIPLPKLYVWLTLTTRTAEQENSIPPTKLCFGGDCPCYESPSPRPVPSAASH